MRKVLLITLIISSMLAVLFPSKSILKSASFSVQLCPRFLPIDCTTSTTTPGDGTPFAAFVVIEGFSPDKSYAIKSRIGPYTQDMTYAISWKNVNLNKWAVDNTSSSDLIKINTDSSGNWKGWVVAKVKKTAPQGTLLYRIRLDVEPYGGNYTDSFSIGTNSLNMETQGGWIEGIAYDTYGNPVSGYPVIVKDSIGTIVGIYLTEDNGVIEGYPSNPGYFKVSAPVGGPYSVEICDPVTLGTIGKITSGVFVIAGQITAGININEPVYYKLNVNIIGEGSVGVIPNSISGIYLEGTEVTLTATPSAGYHFVSWAGDIPMGDETDNPLKIIIDSDRTVTATFEINTYTIVASAEAGGTITPSGTVSITYGVDQTFTINADAGYHIKDVLVDGNSVGAVSNYMFTNINSDHSIKATFAINSYTITTSSGPGGSINPSGTITANYGENMSFEIKADQGFLIYKVIVDGKPVNIPDLVTVVYTFKSISSNHTISAEFVKIFDTTPPTLTLPIIDGVDLNVPGNVLNTTSGILTFFVFATDDSGIARLIIKVNGVVQIDKNNLDPTIYLSEGENIVEVTIYDTYGNYTTKSFRVYRDSNPPVVNLSVPESTSSPIIEISGFVYDETSGIKSFLINGIEYPVSPSGMFSATLTLEPGINNIIVKAIDKLSNVTTKIYSITYSLSKPKTTVITLKIDSPYIVIDGISNKIDAQGSKPIIQNGKTFLPIRTLFESIGGIVEWNTKEKKITIILNGHSINLWISKAEAIVDGSKKTLDITPFIINGRTYLPLRFISENLGASVNWDSATNTITIYYC